LGSALLQAQKVLDLLGRRQHRALFQLLCQRAACELHHRNDLGALGRPQALDSPQIVGAGMQQAAQPVEPVEQLLRELQHRNTCQPGAQQQRDQLGIRERRRAQRLQLFARPCIGRDFLEHHRVWACVPAREIVPSLSNRFS
jgi:hypothetical protein